MTNTTDFAIVMLEQAIATSLEATIQGTELVERANAGDLLNGTVHPAIVITDPDYLSRHRPTGIGEGDRRLHRPPVPLGLKHARDILTKPADFLIGTEGIAARSRLSRQIPVSRELARAKIAAARPVDRVKTTGIAAQSRLSKASDASKAAPKAGFNTATQGIRYRDTQSKLKKTSPELTRAKNAALSRQKIRRTG